MTEQLIEQFQVLKAMTTGLPEEECKAAWMTIDHIKAFSNNNPPPLGGVFTSLNHTRR